MKKSWLLLLLPIALVVWWAMSRADSAPVIHFSAVGRTTIESTVATNGKVEPAQWAAARALSPGVVNEISVQRGEAVKSGQVLVTLDTQMAKSELESALARKQEAAVDAAIVNGGGKASTVATLNDSLRTAQAALDVAQRNYDSLSRLAQQQAATKLQVDEARDALERAKLHLSSIENQRRTLITSADKNLAQARVEGAQAAVELAQHRLTYGSVKSPMDGTLYQFDLKKGAYLQAGELVGLVGTLDRMKVTVYVDEPDLGRVGQGMPVEITWDARPGMKWKGHVDQLPSQVVALGTRTVGEVTTIVENPNHDLLPGVTVNATIISKVVKDAASIPKAALRTIRGDTGVYKLSGDHLAWTAVKAGVSDISNVQVVSGLSAGDKVADRAENPPDAEIRDGMRVRVAGD
jgi:HlyD family secretion protein